MLQEGDFTSKKSEIGLGCNACESLISSATAEPTQPVDLVTVALQVECLRFIFFGTN